MIEVREPAKRNPYLAPKAPVMDSKIDGRGAQPAARSRSTAGDRILAPYQCRRCAERLIGGPVSRDPDGQGGAGQVPPG